MSAKRTALYELQKKAGAKFTIFSGWEMPVLFSSIVQEHQAVRNSAGLFDISHMGQIFVQGPAALEFLQKVTTNDISACRPGKALYSHICNDRGGVVDDIFVYCLTSENYLVIVNAGTAEKDEQWLLGHKIPNAQIENQSSRFGMIAIQGPASEKIVSGLFSKVPGRHEFTQDNFSDSEIFLCRTGYTGEDGFEIVVPEPKAPELWERLMQTAKKTGSELVPCGLGARDTLRLEVGYPLYGQDIDDDHTPLEAGLSWVVKFQKETFIGKEALLKQKTEGVKQKLMAFRLTEQGIPRHGFKIFCNGTGSGAVTSGTFSPSLKTGIALGYVPAGQEGSFAIECHSKLVPAAVTKLPFYNKGSKPQ